MTLGQFHEFDELRIFTREEELKETKSIVSLFGKGLSETRHFALMQLLLDGCFNVFGPGSGSGFWTFG